MTAPELALAYALDLLLGDPEWFPHPVRWFGALTGVGERWLRECWLLGRGPKSEMFAGAVLTGSVASAGWALGRPNNAMWQVLLAWTALATRSLLDESRSAPRSGRSKQTISIWRGGDWRALWAAIPRISTKAKSAGP